MPAIAAASTFLMTRLTSRLRILFAVSRMGIEESSGILAPTTRSSEATYVPGTVMPIPISLSVSF